MKLTPIIVLFYAALLPFGSPRSFGQESTTEEAQADEEELSEAARALTPHHFRFDRAFTMINKQERKLDPFGIPMNQEMARYEPVIEEQDELSDPRNTEDMLEAALRKLTITGVMPRTGTILMGGRALKVGQTLTIQHENVLFRLRLSRVTGQHLEFADVENNKIATLPLKILPLGMIKQSSSKRKLPTGAQPLSVEMVVK